ncbi:hypothetical protein Tco_0594917 [Tanacetum coccineum]
MEDGYAPAVNIKKVPWLAPWYIRVPMMGGNNCGSKRGKWLTSSVGYRMAGVHWNIQSFMTRVEKTMEVLYGRLLGLWEFFPKLPLLFRHMLQRCEHSNLSLNWGGLEEEPFWSKRALSYLIMNKSIVHTDHSALKYLFAKKDAKARMLPHGSLLQGTLTSKFIDTKGRREPPIRSSVHDWKNPYMKTTVTRANVKEKLHNVMRCLKTPSKFVKSLTFGASTLWARSRLHEGTSLSRRRSGLFVKNGFERKALPTNDAENMELLTVLTVITTNKCKWTVSIVAWKRILEWTIGGKPLPLDCPDCEDSQFCHSSRVSHPQLHLGIRYPNLID